jgi:hypothetical protein
VNNNFDVEVLFNDVIVYKNALPNTSTIMDIIKKSKLKEKADHTYFLGWNGWYTFGDQVSMPWVPYVDTIEELISNEFVVKDSEILDGEDEEKYVAEAISSVFYAITKDYMARTNTLPLDWTPMGIAVCRYQVIETPEMGMAYHTDYAQSKVHEPGYKFGITCTMYPNDNYKGGEILFLNTDTTQVIEYTPSAGDIVMFPSGAPYYHGVNKILEGEKYIVRLFWGYNFPGSEEWFLNEEKYGKEEWAKMQAEEVKRHFHVGTYHKEVVWDEEELNHERFIPGEDPTVMPYLSKYPMIKKGKKK